MVVNTSAGFAEPALVTEEPFALYGRGIDGCVSVGVYVMVMRRG